MSEYEEKFIYSSCAFNNIGATIWLELEFRCAWDTRGFYIFCRSSSPIMARNNIVDRWNGIIEQFIHWKYHQ